MNILEYQAKQLLASYGIKTPSGDIASTADAAVDVGGRLGGGKWMVKAQVDSGGRGLGTVLETDSMSGVMIAHNVRQIGDHANGMLGRTLVIERDEEQNGQRSPEGKHKIDLLYIEQALEIDKEMAFSILVDESRRSVVLMLCREGGVDIEESAVNHPGSVFFVTVDAKGGIQPNELDHALQNFALHSNLVTQLRKIIGDAVRLFFDKDATLIEINPLAVVGDELVALDAKMSFDDNALFRQPDIKQRQSLDSGGLRKASIDGFKEALNK